MISRLLTLFSILLAFTATVEAQTKRAFVVGVADYSDASNASGIDDLTRTINDARAYRDRFRALGWTVTPLENPTKAEFDRAFGAFVDSIGPGDEVAFIFSGHGWSYQAENYLTFIDTPFDNTGFTTRNLSVPLKTGVLFPLQRADRPRDRRPRIVVAFIDACRERPFDPGTMTIDAQMGLRPVQPPEGMMLVYSAREGEFAYDRLGKDDPSPNSLFSRNMLAALENADRPLFDIAFDVRDAVKAEAERNGKRQTPAVYAEASRAYCLAEECRTGPPPPRDSDEAEIAWQYLQFSTDMTTLLGFAAKNTQHPRAIDALARVARLRELAQEENPPQPGEVFRDCAECPEMVVIPAGEFLMGSPESEEGRYDDEGPQRTVRIGYQFAVGKFEVTWAEWEACVADGGCESNLEKTPIWGAKGDAGWGKGSRPVINVSWEDAQAYVAWLSRKTGERYRLLSESEFEYANRSGTTSAYAWGSDRNGGCLSANGADASAKSRYSGWTTSSCDDGHVHTSPAGSYRANAFGLYDMTGNVWEWVEDCYENSYSGAPTDGSARDASNCSRRVLRGGSWFSFPIRLRSANRNWNDPTYRNFDVGFRVARML